MKDYKWSSYNNYIEGKGIVDVGFYLGILGKAKEIEGISILQI